MSDLLVESGDWESEQPRGFWKRSTRLRRAQPTAFALCPVCAELPRAMERGARHDAHHATRRAA
jgi:hypothetical protein